jgi:DNA-binding HxlR family transcriptional regulator
MAAAPKQHTDQRASPRANATDRGLKESVCPASQALDLVAHKWTVHILFVLYAARGAVRFGAIQRAAAPITQKELTKRLRELERSGLIARKVYAEVPPRVEYRLTELGQTLIPTLTALHEWAEKYGAAVDVHRKNATSAPSGQATQD